MDRSSVTSGRVGLMLIAAALTSACGDSPNPAGPPDPGLPTLRLPVRVHVLSSRLANIAGTFSDQEVAALLARVNEIWAQGDVEWQLESVVREPAEAEDAFEQALQGVIPLTSTLLASVFPRGQLSSAWDVFIVRDLTVTGGPGVYFPSIPMVVTSEIDPAGLGDPGRILAHELGHSLTLSHVPCTPAGNLMSPSCASQDRRRLDEGQIQRARSQAALGVPTNF
ncbi:MAG: hypothetical protein ACC682_06965 [Gemmatimonadota bacterium]